MLKTIKQFFENNIGRIEEQAQDSQHRLQVATTALLLEIARADFKIEAQELEQIAAGLQAKFALSEQAVQELMTIASVLGAEPAS